MRRKVKKEEKFCIPFLTREVIIVSSFLILAFILRLIYLSSLKANDPGFYNPPSGTDMLTYHNLAKQIVDGTLPKEPYFYGPLYFYFLALIYKLFGEDPYIARLIQMILGVLTTFLTYLIAKRVFNKTIGYISLIISILYPMFYIHEGVLLMEPLITFLNTLSIFLLLRIENSPSYKNIALSGIALGLSALSRANILLFIPFILVWFLMSPKLKAQGSRLIRYAFLCLIIILTIFPVTIRNYFVSKRFVLISTNGPINLWIGNNPYNEGEFSYPPSDYSDKVSEKVKEKGGKAYIEEVIKFAKEYPEQYFRLLFKKFLLFWNSTEIANNINYELYKNLSWVLKITLFGFSLVGSLSLLGIFFSLKNWKNKFLVYIFGFAFMLSTILFFITARYRIAIVPLLIIFASFIIYWWYEKIRAKRFQLFILSLIPLIFSLLLIHSRAVGSIVAPYIYPNGFRFQREKEIIIRDNGGFVEDKEYYILQSPKDMIKKELIVQENLDKFKEVVFSFDFYCKSNLQDKTQRLIFEVNKKGKEIEILPTSFIMRSVAYFIPNDLKKGKNIVIIKPKTNINFPIEIMIDTTYSFGRSYFNKNSQWEKLKNGEYAIWLSLRPERSIRGLMDSGNNYFKKKMYNEAILEYKKAKKLAEKEKINKDLLTILYNIAIINGKRYYERKMYDKAIFEYKKAEEFIQKIRKEN